MIGKLTGLVDTVEEDRCLIDVGGVGYLVFASAATLGRLQAGQGAALLIETHVREDHIHLFGFAERGEREWFRLLSTVQGVGARVALAILSVLSPDQLATAVAAQDKAAVARANGVGPKLAGRIVTELKDKAGALVFHGSSQTAPSAGAAANGAAPAGDALAQRAEDAISALVNLGYKRSEAFTAVAAASRDLGGEAGLDALIRAGLKELAL
ncbi:Holliday junction branch migration protein RuvA [Algihabitans albus]|uniref:Holliday junction branch migration protein RuvA n=1 Tax=Algihabitans albus TaxID=2164067 RepID=UPI000E5D00B7|nr:Holliday junction branch migration protein RuvA [Algihabitans albus]